MTPPPSERLEAARQREIAREAKKPEPTQEQLEKARRLSSQIYYSFRVRPETGSSARKLWYAQFYKVVMSLCRVLGKARFFELPAFIIGTLAEYNKASRQKRDMNVDAIVAGERNDMLYREREDGPVHYLPESELKDHWWVLGMCGGYLLNRIATEYRGEHGIGVEESHEHEPSVPKNSADGGVPPGNLPPSPDQPTVEIQPLPLLRHSREPSRSLEHAQESSSPHSQSELQPPGFQPERLEPAPTSRVSNISQEGQKRQPKHTSSSPRKRVKIAHPQSRASSKGRTGRQPAVPPTVPMIVPDPNEPEAPPTQPQSPMIVPDTTIPGYVPHEPQFPPRKVPFRWRWMVCRSI